MHRLRLETARPLVVALMATSGRDDRFLERSIGSIVAQRRRPDVLVVVVDHTAPDLSSADPATRARVTGCARRLAGDIVRLEILENERTPGAAGAWNTGLDWAHREWSNPDRVFVAVLDDDDAWEPDHIEACLTSTIDRDLDMVAAGLLRIERDASPRQCQAIPTALDLQALLATGQHIQGSNLFVRLDRMLEAGLFDENLRSCTDRDLVARLAMLSGFKFGALDRHTVLHFADDRPDRLSAPGSEAKLQGLTEFLHKWRGTMNDETRVRFVERASVLFGWRPPSDPARPTCRLADPLRTESRTPVSLVVGIIVDPAYPGRVEPLLDQLLTLTRRPDVVGLDVLLLENGAKDIDCTVLRTLVTQWQHNGLRCFLITHEQQETDVSNGWLEGSTARDTARHPIAVARARVAFYAAHHARSRRGAWVWLLDDDTRIEGPNKDDSSFRCPDLDHLKTLAEDGVRVAYGRVVGAPPLPFLACLRTQALDALFALLESTHESRARDADRVRERLSELRALARDYYYDLSRRDTRLLETPFPLMLSAKGESQLTLLTALAPLLPRALAGEQVTRPLELSGTSDDLDSIRRGPTALWFHPEDLLLAPNTLARVGDTFTRRSDMLVALLSRDMHRLKSVETSAITVRQDRSDLVPEGDPDKLRLDILGYALYSALEDVLQGCREPSPSRAEPASVFDEVDLRVALSKFRKYVDERCFALSLSAWRLRGIESSARAWIEREAPALPDTKLEAGRRIVETLSTFARSLTPQLAEELRLACHEFTDGQIRGSFASILPTLRAQRAKAARNFDIRAALHEQRVFLAEAALKRALGTNNLRYLGAGAEGVAFSDGARAFKVIDYWKARDRDRAISFLHGLVGRPTGSVCLPLVLEFIEDGGVAILVTPFIDTTPYVGGHGPSLVQLLRDCRRLGIVCRNVHPKNLRVCGEDVLLVDYGSDLREFDEVEFLRMAKRCWLTWRWSHRADLDELMRRSITEDDFPEMHGFERFLATIDVPTVGEVLDPLLLALIGDPIGLHVLDFGCGKGRLAARLANAGANVTAYDPDSSHAPRWRMLEAGTSGHLHFVADRDEAIVGGTYDVVFASLVLCEITDEASYRAVLCNLRAAVRSQGIVVIAVCNPFSTFGGRTPLHPHRQLPRDTTYDDVFVFHEHVGVNCASRVEVHRPFHRLRRDLLRSGLHIEAVHHSAAVDLDRFEPASDFLVLVARPVLRHPTESTLVIKSCPQEWRTIDAQVRHLVETLDGPFAFRERVLAIDTRERGFPRQYSEPDVAAFESALGGLVRAGFVDRVVRATDDPEYARDLNLRWFGVDSPARYAQNGQATLAFLAAIESCTTPLVVQVDSDLMLSRPKDGADWLADVEALFERDPKAITVSLSIACKAARPFTVGFWRVETRGSVLHRERVMALRPLPNQPAAEMLALPWHRAMDRLVAAGRAHSYRGANPGLFFIHPPNDTKREQEDWMLVLDGISRGFVPAWQFGEVDWRGSVDDFLPRARSEAFVFVVTGRNVHPGRMQRCLTSIHAQHRRDWGLVVVDDGSSAQSAEFLELWAAENRDRVTLVRPRLRRGQLANLRDAIRTVCTSPDSVILTVDLDDELLGPTVLDRVAVAYDAGADATVGSMLRTDKHREYTVDFDSPRTRRGGNVWQHLRTFRKHLFDSIPESELRIDDHFVEFATDWAFMLPIIERARQPVWIKEPLYLYEPSGHGKGRDRLLREREIGALCARPLLARLAPGAGGSR